MRLKIRHLLLATLLLPFINACHTPKSAQNSGKHSLRIMTYNIHHANPPSKENFIDLEAIAKVINKAKPDLVALQEVDVNTERSGKEINEAKELAKLTNMHYHFTRALHYQGGKYGDAVLSRFPVIDTFNYNLPKVEGTREEIRSLCMIKIKIPGGDTIFFASTHLGLSKATRLLQAEKLTNIITSLSKPLILAGDLNARPESETIQLLDKIMTRSCNKNCAFTIPVKNPNRKIDYIMYRPADKFKPIDQEVIHETYPSDHLPVVVELRF